VPSKQTATASTGDQGTTTEATADTQSEDSVGLQSDMDAVESDTSSDPDIAELEAQVAELTAAVEAQNEQLQKQERTIKQLIKELRQGR
jgi:uncharacterized membrane protein